jgi:hypothetical protein
MAVQNLQEEELDRGDRREHAVAPWGIPDLPAHRKHSVGLQQHSPLAGEALHDSGHVRDHLVTSSMMGVLPPLHTGDA